MNRRATTDEPKVERGVAPVGYLELLRRNHDFRQLWLGQVISQLGDWFDTIALYTLILRLTGSGRAIGLLLVARFLPSVFLGPLAGAVADRFDRRRVMIASDLGRAVVVLGFLFIRRADQMWMLYVLTVLQLALSTFFEPAKTASIPSVVSVRELIPANTISSVTWSAMLTLGAAIGGLITGQFGTDAAFLLDSLTYLVSAAFIARIRLPPQRARAKTKLTVGHALGLSDTLEGIRYVGGRRRVLALLLVKPAWCMGGGILSLLAVFGEKIFPVGGRGATGIGVLYAARGIGTGIGPFLARRLAGDSRASMQTAIGISFFLGALFYIAFGLATNLASALAVLAIAHMGGSILWVFSTSHTENLHRLKSIQVKKVDAALFKFISREGKVPPGRHGARPGRMWRDNSRKKVKGKRQKVKVKAGLFYVSSFAFYLFPFAFLYLFHQRMVRNQSAPGSRKSAPMATAAVRGE